jgi:hypothetical protein
MSGVPIVGDVLDFAGDVLESVGDIVEDTFDAVVGAIEDVGRAIGDAVEAVGDALSEIGEFAQVIVERYAIQVALMAMGLPPYIAGPMSAGMHTLAKGGSPEDALKSAATVAVIQQVGQAVQGGMEAANADAIAQGGEAAYTAAEIAAATSAAQSAVAAAASGGDIEKILTSAAIGGVTGAAATEVYKATGSVAAANFARVTMQSTLQGVELKEAILMGASASMVSYLQTMNKYANESSDVSRSRAASVQAYKNRVENYNEKLDLYNQAKEAGDTATANNYARELNAELKIINNLSDQIGSFNTQLKDLSDKYKVEQGKAEEEAKKTGFDFKPKTDQMLAEEQTQRDELADTLIKLVGETEGRRYEGIDIAGGLPAGIDESIKTLPLIGEEASELEDLGDGRFTRTVTTQDADGNVRQYNIIIDAETNKVTYAVPEYATEDNPLGEVEGRPDYRTMTASPGKATEFTPDMQAQGYYQDEEGAIRTPSGNLYIEISGLADKPQLIEDVGQLLGQRPTLTESEIAAINTQARESRGGAIRGAVETDLFEKELERFEQDLQEAEDAAARDASRRQFVEQQRQRLQQAGRLPGTLQAQIDAELEGILDEYEQTKGRATEAASRREQVVASQQERRGEISDEEIMRLIGLSPEEGERYGLGTGGGAGFRPTEVKPISEEPPETAPEGEIELGGGEGEGEPPARRFDAQGRAITTTAVAAGDRTREEGTPGISSRVTGEALVGILGEKEPLFGGDEDEQRAVWNRRSLRLRKALGL